VKIGGQTRKVALAELQSGYQRHQDYTQKTMALAEERRRIEAQWNGERQQVREFLSRPENVQQLLQHLQQQRGPQLDPSQPVTAQQLQQMLAQREQALMQSQVQQRQQMMQELEMKHMEDGYKSEIQKHVADILTQHPELKTIRNIDYLLKQAAAQGQPATLDDAKSLMLQAATEQATAIRNHFTEQQKQSAIQKQSLSRGIEPPGGAAPLPQGKSTGRMGSPEFNADVSAYLQQLSSANKGV
jgi:hypothetical protein